MAPTALAALNVGVVVDLDALRQPRQLEHPLHALEQLGLGLRLRQLAPQGLARVGHRMADQAMLFAALRHGDLDPPPGAQRQRIGDELALLDLWLSSTRRGAGLSS
jgi:hypothetical protein